MNLLSQNPPRIHPSEVWKEQSEWESISRAQYAGSFPVVGENQDERMECVRKMLLEMKNVGKMRPVLLAISLSGIKVCSHTGESILMAHALKRISYATCHPEFCQFSFLAREPKAHTNFQHCHVFVTKNSQEAEEVNSVMASAFNVAYACQRRSQVMGHPTFNELIRHQLDSQKEGFAEFSRRQEEALAQRLCQIATPLVDQRLEERRQRRQNDRDDREKRICQNTKERNTWTKRIVDQASHGCLLSDDGSQSLSPPTASALPQDDVFRQTLLGTNVPLCGSETSDPFFSDEPDAELRGHRCSGDFAEECYLCPVPCCPEIPKMDATGSELEFLICRHMVEEKSLSDDEYRNNERTNRPSSRPNSVEGSEARTSPHAGVGEGRTTGRPLSGKYQNDEAGMKTSRDSSRDPDGRDIYQGPPTPIRHDSLRKMNSSQGMLFDELQDAPWYQPTLPREMALEILSQQDIGSFVIRDSTTHPGCYALSVKVPRYDNPTGISHYLITRTAKGSFKIKGLEKEWPTLSSLVTHHTVMRELLPCLLHLSRSSGTISSRDLDKDGNY